VREHDEYDFMPGQLDREVPPRWHGPQEIPYHRYRPFSGASTRGELIGVYAYARMLAGTVSRVVQLGADDIARIKASSQGSDSEYSPWVNHTEAMWLKSAVRQLQKWVPTSAEYRREMARTAAEAQRIATAPEAPVGADHRHEDVWEGEVVDEADVDVAADGSTLGRAEPAPGEVTP
jgi:recombination protein RecT